MNINEIRNRLITAIVEGPAHLRTGFLKRLAEIDAEIEAQEIASQLQYKSTVAA